MTKILLSILFGLGSTQGFGLAPVSLPGTPAVQDSSPHGPLLAKKKKRKKRRGKRAVRKRHLTSEARSKKGNRTSIDFDEAAIDGNRRTPTGVAISKNRPDQEYDLINLRLRWHPEMIQSTANLETGRGR